MDIRRCKHGTNADEDGFMYCLACKTEKSLAFDDAYYARLTHQAAIAAMQGLASITDSGNTIDDDVECAVTYATALVAEIRKGQK